MVNNVLLRTRSLPSSQLYFNVLLRKQGMVQKMLLDQIEQDCPIAIYILY